LTTKVVPGLLHAKVDAVAVAHEAAARIARTLREAIESRGAASLALSGGTTPRATYLLLGREAGIDWKHVRVFWVDERAVPPESERSNYHLVQESLLQSPEARTAQVFRMRGEAKDLDTAAREYERMIRVDVAAGGAGVPEFDAVVLGIGDDGHTASLFPGRPEIDIVDRLVVAVPAEPPREARLTLTRPLLEHARTTFILAVGKSKTAALERVWLVGGDLHATPARLVRGIRGAVMWFIDRSAGGI
jgi:6-phosphogluconolactonase